MSRVLDRWLMIFVLSSWLLPSLSFSPSSSLHHQARCRPSTVRSCTASDHLLGFSSSKALSPSSPAVFVKPILQAFEPSLTFKLTGSQDQALKPSSPQALSLQIPILLWYLCHHTVSHFKSSNTPKSPIENRQAALHVLSVSVICAGTKASLLSAHNPIAHRGRGGAFPQESIRV
jgi:hypothetical protein